ncbi:hypothetical protein F5887DRAFT_949516 [Amanita rubescens]|nr:hypothetical protein F5887DRAFT_949516 [Amanita rubescens]
MHPLFTDPNADTVLRSIQGTTYRIPAFILRDSCTRFKSLKLQHAPIQVPHNDNTLDRFLRMISGLEIPVWVNLDDFESVLALADAWGAAGPLSTLRSSVTSPPLLKHPIRLYRLTSRMKWEEERKIASMFTLSLSIYDEDNLEQLQQLPSPDLLDLLLLHRRRRDEFQARIDAEMAFNAGNALHYLCAGCAADIDNHAWRALKLRMVLELDKRPLGDTLMEMLDEWPEALACWSASCPNNGCGRLYYDKASTLRDIRACLQQLPSTV